MLHVATKFAPIPEAFRTALDAGFQCAELWSDAAVLADWQGVAKRAAAYPLRYGLHFPNRKDLEPKSLKHCVALYEALGCRALVIHQPHYDLYGADLLRLKPDMVLAIENHRLKPDALVDWFADTDHLTLDVEHVWKFTLHDPPLDKLWETLDPLLKKHGHKLRHVHLPGYTPGYDEHRPMYCNRDLVFGMFDRLARLGYDGLIVSEVEMEFQNLNDLRMDVILTDSWHRQQSPPARRDADSVLNR